MKIFLDTANLESIKKYNDMGLLDGITTNPSLLSKEGGDPQKTMEEITRIIKGDVSLEVVATDYEGMMEEGRRLVPRRWHVAPKELSSCSLPRQDDPLCAEGIPEN